jgi:hypothetical protein
MDQTAAAVDCRLGGLGQATVGLGGSDWYVVLQGAECSSHIPALLGSAG